MESVYQCQSSDLKPRYQSIKEVQRIKVQGYSKAHITKNLIFINIKENDISGTW